MNTSTKSKYFHLNDFETGPVLFVCEPYSDRMPRFYLVNWETYTPFISREKTNHKTNFPKYRILLELRTPINRRFIYSYLETEEKEYLADIEILKQAQKAFGWQDSEIINMANYPLLSGLICGRQAASC